MKKTTAGAGAGANAAEVLDDLVRIDDPGSLPEDLEKLYHCHILAEDLLLWHSDTLEPNWAQAEACGQEIARLHDMQAAVLARAAGLRATGLEQVRRKLLLWQSVTEACLDEQGDGGAHELIRSVIRDLDSLCGASERSHPPRPN